MRFTVVSGSLKVIHRRDSLVRLHAHGWGLHPWAVTRQDHNFYYYVSRYQFKNNLFHLPGMIWKYIDT